HAVYAFDYQGHGRSEGVRGGVGSFSELTEDAAYFLQRVHSDHPDIPWLVMGHGLGSNIAVKLASVHSDIISGLILSAPAVNMDRIIPRVVQDVARNLASVYSSMPVMRLDTRHISRDPEVVNGYKKDPLVYHGCLRAGMSRCMDEAASETLRVLNRITIPVWIGHGSKDSIHDPADSMIIINSIGSKDKTLKIFHNLYHEILNEPERIKVVTEITHWIEKRLGQFQHDNVYRSYGMQTG
ncbi:MAG: lysophospholipase, partial [Balneolales bacterium]